MSLETILMLTGGAISAALGLIAGLWTCRHLSKDRGAPKTNFATNLTPVVHGDAIPISLTINIHGVKNPLVDIKSSSPLFVANAVQQFGESFVSALKPRDFIEMKFVSYKDGKHLLSLLNHRWYGIPWLDRQIEIQAAECIAALQRGKADKVTIT